MILFQFKVAHFLFIWVAPQFKLHYCFCFLNKLKTNSMYMLPLSLIKLLKPYITRSTLSKPCLLSHTNASVWFKSCCLICLTHLPGCYCQFKRWFKSSPQRMDWLSRVMATAVLLFKGTFGSNL